MSIERFYNTVFTVARQVWSGDSSAETVQGTFNGLIEQGISKTLDQNSAFRFTKPYTVFCPIGTDVQEGDKLTENSRTYDIKYVIKEEKGGNGHLELIAERND